MIQPKDLFYRKKSKLLRPNKKMKLFQISILVFVLCSHLSFSFWVCSSTSENMSLGIWRGLFKTYIGDTKDLFIAA